MTIEIRRFAYGEESAIEAVNLAAFDGSAEAALVARLRAAAQSPVELVAVEDGAIVGHLLFSPATLDSAPDCPVMGLAPMAVLPGHQRRGVGSALLQAGLERCRELGQQAIFVLGHPSYYPRFGFVPASRYGIVSRYEVPEPVFMALELEPGVLAGKAGRLHYDPAFDELG